MSYSIVIPFTYRATSVFVMSLCIKNPASETKYMEDFRYHHFEKFAKLTKNLRSPLLTMLLLFLGWQRNIKIPIIYVAYEQLWVI